MIRSSRVYDELIEWNFSANLRKLVSTNKQTIYCGFDPTAKSLHIGNLVGISFEIHKEKQTIYLIFEV